MSGLVLAFAAGHGAVLVDVEVVAARALEGPAEHADEQDAAADDGADVIVMGEEQAADEQAGGGHEGEPGLAGHVDAAMGLLILGVLGGFGGDLLGVGLLIPEGVAGVHGGRDVEVVLGRRGGGHRPLEGAGVPDVAGGLLALEVGIDHDREVDADAEGEDEGADGGDEVGAVPTHVAVVNGGAARHAVEA